MLVSDAVAYALRVAGVLGVGQVPLVQDLADATTALQMMLAQWQRKRWLVYRLDEIGTKAEVGKASYSIGPNGDVEYPLRPGSVEAAYLRQLTGPSPTSFPVDYPLARIRSREEWSAISLKTLGSWPSAFFYDPIMELGTSSIAPLGRLYVWPIPVQEYFELHLTIPVDIRPSPAADTEIDQYLPPEYEEAIIYNLAMRLALNYKMTPDPGLASAARASLNTLRQTNYTASHLQMPGALRHGSRMKNPMAGFVETAASVGTTVLR